MGIRSGASESISIGQLIQEIGRFSDDLTAYVPDGQVSPETTVLLVDEEVDGVPEGGVDPLEVEIIKEVISVWREWRNGADPSLRQAFDAVIYYAVHDAYEPVGG